MKVIDVHGAFYREIHPFEILEDGDAELFHGTVFYPIQNGSGKPSREVESSVYNSIRVRRLNTAMDKPKPTYTERDIIELACRAPACPEWFEPLPNTAKAILIEDDYHPKNRILSWPRAYAKMVLEAP